MMRLFAGMLLAWISISAEAHKPSDSYLTLKVEGQTLSGHWDIALRDLDYAIGLDTNANGAITWGELRARHDAITAYALPRLRISAQGADCPAQVEQHLVDHHTDGAYAVLRLRAQCPHTVKAVELRYRLLFDLDPSHKGLLNLSYQQASRSAIFSPERSTQHFDLQVMSPWQAFWDYVGEGVWHIWIGFDHILFLLSLLLPSVLTRVQGRWQAVTKLRSAMLDVVKTVTAFTVAHSITLSLAALGWIDLPSRLVESAIAASVILAALNNVYPLVLGRRWIVAFGFGLIHGLGFAGVLADLGLPAGALLSALLGFNLGVEAGQLAIVAIFIPVAYGLRRSWAYRRLAVGLGSLLIAAMAGIWFVERSLDVSLAFN